MSSKTISKENAAVLSNNTTKIGIVDNTSRGSGICQMKTPKTKKPKKKNQKK